MSQILVQNALGEVVRGSWVPESWDASVIRVAVWGGQLQVESMVSCHNGLLKRRCMAESVKLFALAGS
jgi:hypothetical protein